MRSESPLQYLEKHDEPTDPRKLETALRNLSEPIGRVEYSSDDEVNIKSDSFNLGYKYYQISDIDLDTLSDLNIQTEDIKGIKNLHFGKANNSASINFNEIIPEGYRVYMVSGHKSQWSDFVSIKDKIIVLNGDIRIPETILALLHEIGHIHADPKKQEDSFAPEPNQDRRTINADDLARKLLNERDAWAYALKKIKPFFYKGEDQDKAIRKEDVIAYAKDKCLQSYNKWASKLIDERYSAHHFAMDYFDDIDGYYESITSE